MKKINQVVLCFVGGLGREKYEQNLNELKFLNKLQCSQSSQNLFLHPKSPGDKERLLPAYKTLLRCPLEKKKKNKVLSSKILQAQKAWKKMELDSPSWDWTDKSIPYLLTTEELKQNEFPLIPPENEKDLWFQLDPFVNTENSKSEKSDKLKVAAIDCEMVITRL